MKVLVVSDSHSSLAFMRRAVVKLRPEFIVHLGDHYSDGQVIAEENPNIRVIQLPGNCDCFSIGADQPQVICCSIGGVRCYMTHGHMHYVKSGFGRLIAAAKEAGASVAMFGHTHSALCQNADGLLLINPGSCRGFGGSVCLMEIEENEISSCRILWQEDIG